MANLIIQNDKVVAVLSDRASIPHNAVVEKFDEGEFLAIYGDDAERIGHPTIDPRDLVAGSPQRKAWDEKQRRQKKSRAECKNRRHKTRARTVGASVSS